jgi:hypothetical protein
MSSGTGVPAQHRTAPPGAELLLSWCPGAGSYADCVFERANQELQR